MKTITVTEAKRSLGRYLAAAAAGEDIGIICGTDIIALRKVEVFAVDRLPENRLQEAPANFWPEFPTFDGGPVDAAANHDSYLYDAEPQGKRRKPSH